MGSTWGDPLPRWRLSWYRGVGCYGSRQLAYLFWGLLTGWTYWTEVDQDGALRPRTHREKYRRRDVWAILGPSSWNWWWVRRWGKQNCGCTKNPLTRRMILMVVDCPQHGLGPEWNLAILDASTDWDEDASA
jgi:hypothetical protein